MSAMKFVKVASSRPVVDYLTGVLNTKLEEGVKTLWLVPGGSAISIAVEVGKQIAGHHNIGMLSVTLTDERYGPIGHKDSNWAQLQASGFDLVGARLVPVLDGSDRNTTTEVFGKNLQELLGESTYKIGLFGIGADGHTAGILPDTTAVFDPSLTSSYATGNFERITITPKAIGQLNEVVVYGVGEAKWPVFDDLGNEIEISAQPAQALKSVPELTIFNDHKEDVE